MIPTLFGGFDTKPWSRLDQRGNAYLVFNDSVLEKALCQRTISIFISIILFLAIQYISNYGNSSASLGVTILISIETKDNRDILFDKVDVFILLLLVIFSQLDRLFLLNSSLAVRTELPGVKGSSADLVQPIRRISSFRINLLI